MDLNDLVVPMILDPLQEERVTVTGRVLNIPESLQTVGVKTDNKVERIYFELPRYFDGFNDFSEFNFYINYVNANGEGDVYYCDDLEIEDDNVVFSWLTKEKLYAKNGTAQFTVRAYHSDGRVWNTTIAQLNILDALETQEAVVEQDYDFINQQFEIIRQHTEKLNALIEQVKANTTNLDKAINTMGKAEWNGNQVRFTDGQGNYGQFHDISGEFISRDEIYLGYSMSQDYPYSGHAGNYGIDVAKIVGAYKQDGTPTPDNPVDPQFNVINDFYTSGVNLFNKNDLISGQTVTNTGLNTSATYTGYSTSNYIPVMPITSYYVLNAIVGSKWYAGGFFDKDKNFIKHFSQLNESNYAIETPENCYYIMLNVITSSMNISNDLMLSLGDTAQPYTPFVGSSTTPVSLELRALPDGTADVWEDGNITRNVAKVTFDGSDDENWKYYTTIGTNQFWIIKSGVLYNSDTLCLLSNKFKTILIANRQNNYNTIYSANNGICFNVENINSVEDWKTYLQSNPIDVCYALATPTTEPLTIPTLTSYYPFTNAWCDSEVEPKLIEWHINNKINYLQKLIEEKATV